MGSWSVNDYQVKTGTFAEDALSMFQEKGDNFGLNLDVPLFIRYTLRATQFLN